MDEQFGLFRCCETASPSLKVLCSLVFYVASDIFRFACSSIHSPLRARQTFSGPWQCCRCCLHKSGCRTLR